jgi:hypothetical protein
MLGIKNVVHFWELGRGNCIILKKDFKDRMVNLLLKICKTKYQVAKRTGVSRKTFLKLLKEEYPKIMCKVIIQLTKFLVNNGYNEFELENVEKNIIWIGAQSGKGILNPKLPFNFATRVGARFLSAICNDGTITTDSKTHMGYGTLIYTNTNKDLRSAVIKDAISVFGGDNNIARTKGIYVFFTSVCRDALEMLTNFKGKKSENNPNIPKFILEKKELMCGWIEQVIADEGDVRYYPEQYERAIVWRRSVDITFILKKFRSNTISKELIRKASKIAKCRLIEDERKILKKLSIGCICRPIFIYFTKDGKAKLRWEIRISGNENLKKLRNLIKIPHEEKNKRFTMMLNTYKRR